MYFFSIFIRIQVLTCGENCEDIQSKTNMQQNGLHGELHRMLDNLHKIDACNNNETPRHKTTTNEPTPSSEHKSDKQERFECEASYFCSTAIEKLIQSYEDLYLSDLDYSNVEEYYNIENNLYYIIYKSQKDVAKKKEIPMGTVEIIAFLKSGQKQYNNTIEFSITKMNDETLPVKLYDLYSDEGLMDMYLFKLGVIMNDMIKENFISTVSDFKQTLTKSEIRKSRNSKRFYRVLEEMSILSYGNKKDCIKPYFEKAFHIYKVYTVSIELLGKTMNRLEGDLTISYFKNQEFKDEKPFYDRITRLNPNVIDAEVMLESLHSQCDLMLKYYRFFCEKLLALNTNLMHKCSTECDWDKTMEGINIICNDLNRIVDCLLSKPEVLTFFEVRHVILRVFVELRECIYQSINMIRPQIIINLTPITYKNTEYLLSSVSDQEKICQESILAEKFFNELDKIKNGVANANLNNTVESNINHVKNDEYEDKMPSNTGSYVC